MSWSSFVVVYVLGGLTFIPLVLSIAFLHAYITLPVRDASSSFDGDDTQKNESNDRDEKLSDSVLENLPEELKTRTHVPDVAAGYFAVCREYVPGGINGKPPERTTPAGAVVATESPSVYQSMYRSIFDRNKTMSPTIEGNNGKSKKARNIFYVVLRLGILMLYDDSEQLEVRHVISLTHYEVDVYAGGARIPEGELWIKRNCIRLKQRPQSGINVSDSRPFYLFSDNCSEKEDFYHAMLQSQDHRTDAPRNPPTPLKFNTPDLVRFVQQLHASEENLHTRWINALIGRVFLAMYKTEQVEKFIWTKITKKIARVPKPALISKINLQKIDMGTLPPFITNPKLRELTVDGDLTVEADVSYRGNFRVEISAIARIDLGARFKAREVTLVLATTLKKLDGHILLRMKPPPSNRLWFTFESAPKMELAVEPIVSSRQITYGVILRAIESRLREVVSETLVLPNWDDIPFKDTEKSHTRGGIWTEDAKKDSSGIQTELAEQVIIAAEKGSESEDSDSQAPTLADTGGASRTRTPATSSLDSADTQATAYSSATDIKPPVKPKAMRSGSFASAASPIVNVNAASASATKSEQRERHQDAAAAMKTISMSQPTSPADTPVGSPSQPSYIQDAGRRRSTSPAGFDVDPNQEESSRAESLSIQSSVTLPAISSDFADSPESTPSISQTKSRHGTSLSLPRNTFASTEKRQMFNQSLNSATAAAKKWFAARQNQDGSGSPNPQASQTPRKLSDESTHETGKDSSATFNLNAASTSEIAPLGSPANPIGRGQLIPESQITQTKTEKKNASGWSVPAASTFANLTKRKPVAAKSAPSPQPQLQSSTSDPIPHTPEEQPPPLPARNPTGSHPRPTNHERTTSVGTAAMGVRRKSSAVQPLPSPGTRPTHRPRRSVTESARGSISSLGKSSGNAEEGILVVEAPSMDASAPNSPVKIPKVESKERLDRGSGNGNLSSTPDEGVFQVEVDDGVTS